MLESSLGETSVPPPPTPSLLPFTSPGARLSPIPFPYRAPQRFAFWFASVCPGVRLAVTHTLHHQRPHGTRGCPSTLKLGESLVVGRWPGAGVA